MSSVNRSYAQTPTNTIISYASYIVTFEDMQSVFSGNLSAPGKEYTGAVPVYLGNLVLFKNDEDLAEAIISLENYLFDESLYTSNYTALRDLGEKLHLGIQGGDSKLFTYNLVSPTKGPGADGVYFALTQIGKLSTTIQEIFSADEAATTRTRGAVWTARSA